MFTNCIHKKTLILLDDSISYVETDNIKYYVMKDTMVQDMFDIFECFGDESNIYIHNRLVTLISYAVLKYLDEVIVYFPYALNNKKCVSIYTYYSVGDLYTLKYKSYIYLMNSLLNIKIIPVNVDQTKSILGEIIYTIRVKYTKTKDVEDLIRYLDKYVFNWATVKTAVTYDKPVTMDSLSEALQYIYSIDNKLS